MYYIGVDLGSTNIKVAIYDGTMKLVDRQSNPVAYIRKNGFVEFDGERYFQGLVELMGAMMVSKKSLPIKLVKLP